jgi:hypothetical protein
MPDPSERAYASGFALRIPLEGVLTVDDPAAFAETRCRRRETTCKGGDLSGWSLSRLRGRQILLYLVRLAGMRFVQNYQ